MRVHPYAIPVQGLKEESKPRTSPAAGFAELMRGALQQVNQKQLEASDVSEKLITGEIEDLHQVMIATEQARLSLQLTTQVTNKVIEAYREISRMQI